MDDLSALAGKVIQRGKKPFNGLLTRGLDLSYRLLRVHEFRGPLQAKTIGCLARLLGDACCLLRDFPYLPAWELCGAEGKIVFTGTTNSLHEMQKLCFVDGCEQRRLRGVEVWNLSARTRGWLSGGVDLVICELSRVHPLRPKALLSFSSPIWVDQVRSYPGGGKTLLAGKRARGTRKVINRFQRDGFSWRFSHSRADLDLFYHGMYLPFVAARHGERAWITSCEDQWNLSFATKKGGLVLVEHHGEPVAGGICRIVNDTCFGIEMGVLNADPELIRQGIILFLMWSVSEWGANQGAHYLNLGESRGWRSDGPFRTKAKWGTQVSQWLGIYRTLTFLAGDLPDPLRARLNQAGFLTEAGGAFYEVRVDGTGDALSGQELGMAIREAKNQGLEGLAIVSPQSGTVLLH